VVFTRADGLAFVQLDYDAIERAYVHDPASVVLVTGDGGRTAAIDADSAGRLWIAFVTDTEVLVTSSSDRGATWRRPSPPPVGQTDLDAGEIAALVAFDRSVAVMWSDQRRSRFSFAVHRDDAPLDRWSLETALQGEDLVDDHINLKTDAGGSVYAVTKTSRTRSTDPLLLLLARGTTPSWASHTVATVADNHTRAVLVLDQTHDRIEVYATVGQSGGDIHRKTSPLSPIFFPAGRGEAVIDGPVNDINNATSMKGNISSATGLVVLATGDTDDLYRHYWNPTS